LKTLRMIIPQCNVKTIAPLMFSTSSNRLFSMEIHKFCTGGVAEAGPLAGGDGAVHYDSCAGLWARAARPVGTGFCSRPPLPARRDQSPPAISAKTGTGLPADPLRAANSFGLHGDHPAIFEGLNAWRLGSRIFLFFGRRPGPWRDSTSMLLRP